MFIGKLMKMNNMMYNWLPIVFDIIHQSRSNNLNNKCIFYGIKSTN